MILNVLWLLVFVRDNKWAFMFSTIINFALLYTCVFIMMISCRTELNMFEAIVIRTCFSLYAGWVTAACVLNVFFTLKSWKKSSISDDDFKNVEEEAEKAESYLTVKALWIVDLYCLLIRGIEPIIWYRITLGPKINPNWTR